MWEVKQYYYIPYAVNQTDELKKATAGSEVHQQNQESSHKK